MWPSFQESLHKLRKIRASCSERQRESEDICMFRRPQAASTSDWRAFGIRATTRYPDQLGRYSRYNLAVAVDYSNASAANSGAIQGRSCAASEIFFPSFLAAILRRPSLSLRPEPVYYIGQAFGLSTSGSSTTVFLENKDRKKILPSDSAVPRPLTFAGSPSPVAQTLP